MSLLPPSIQTARDYGNTSFEKLLGKLYFDAKNDRISLVERRYTKFFSGLKVYNFTRSNLKSFNYPSSHTYNHKTQNGKDTDTYINIVENGKSISIYYRQFDNKGIILEPELTKRFFTEYSKELHTALKRLSGWALNGGALTVLVNKTPVAFAEIVWLYRHNKLNMNDFENSLFEAHKELRTSKLLVDHLTHNKENNCLWALALVSDDVNRQLKARDKIKKPFYFLTVYCYSNRTLKIKCGKQGAWEKNFYLNLETDATAVCTPE